MISTIVEFITTFILVNTLRALYFGKSGRGGGGGGGGQHLGTKE